MRLHLRRCWQCRVNIWARCEFLVDRARTCLVANAERLNAKPFNDFNRMQKIVKPCDEAIMMIFLSNNLAVYTFYRINLIDTRAHRVIEAIHCVKKFHATQVHTFSRSMLIDRFSLFPGFLMIAQEKCSPDRRRRPRKPICLPKISFWSRCQHSGWPQQRCAAPWQRRDHKLSGQNVKTFGWNDWGGLE